MQVGYTPHSPRAGRKVGTWCPSRKAADEANSSLRTYIGVIMVSQIGTEQEIWHFLEYAWGKPPALLPAREAILASKPRRRRGECAARTATTTRREARCKADLHLLCRRMSGPPERTWGPWDFGEPVQGPDGPPTNVWFTAEELGRITACSKGSWRAAGALSVLAADEQGRLTLVKDSGVELTIVGLHADEEELGVRAAYGVAADS